MDDQRKEEEHIEAILKEEIARVESARQARAVIEKVERRAGQETQTQRGDAVAESPSSAVESIHRACDSDLPTSRAAGALDSVAAEAVAPTPEAPTVSQAAERVVKPTAPVPPETRRGLELLRHALLERMAPHEALDARVYLAINSLPHPRLLDRLADRVTVITNGGWIWLGCVAAAALLGVSNGRRALSDLAPSLIVTTWVIEHPVKSFFRRKRPFIDIVRALVVGKKPGTWSFPSGHTASSFATAWILGRCWPRAAWAFYGLAGLVGFSRIYVGAHYPGDVAAGATVGLVLARTTRALMKYGVSRVRNHSA